MNRFYRKSITFVIRTISTAYTRNRVSVGSVVEQVSNNWEFVSLPIGRLNVVIYGDEQVGLKYSLNVQRTC